MSPPPLIPSHRSPRFRNVCLDVARGATGKGRPGRAGRKTCAPTNPHTTLTHKVHTTYILEEELFGLSCPLLDRLTGRDAKFRASLLKRAFLIVS